MFLSSFFSGSKNRPVILVHHKRGLIEFMSAKVHNLSQTAKTIAQKSVRHVESVRQKKPPRCISAGGGSVRQSAQ